MPYGIIKIDTVTFTDAGVDKSVSISGLVQNPTFSGNVTVTGTLSGVTVTGTTANFTSGNFTNISGGTHTITSGVFAAGSAASPSITFTGDLNTGIYSPGADQVAISTNGTGRLFVDASGNIGVGTTPDARFTVQDGTSNILRAKQVAFNNYINEGVGLTFVRTSDGAETMAIGVVDVDKLTIASREGILFGVGGGGLYSAVSEAARIDSSGRFLVGTSSGKTVGAGQYSLLNVQGYVGASNGGGDVTLSRGETAANIATGEVLGLISFTDSAGYAFGQFYCEADGNAGTNDYPGRLVFATTADGASSPTERMRINKDGEILFGTSTTTNGCKLALVNTDATRKWGFGTIGTNTYFAVVDDTSGAGVQLNAGSTSWSTFSDERLKDNLAPIQDGLDKVSQLRAVTGRYKTDDINVSRSFLIAQDVQAVLPEAVDIMSDDMRTLSLKYTEVIPLLVSALKESKERIETLEAKVVALESA